MNNQQLAALMIERATLAREKARYHFDQKDMVHYQHLEGVATGLELAAGIAGAADPASSAGQTPAPLRVAG